MLSLDMYMYFITIINGASHNVRYAGATLFINNFLNPLTLKAPTKHRSENIVY